MEERDKEDWEMRMSGWAIGILASLALVCGSPLSCIPAAGQQEGEKDENIGFVWAFAALKKGAGEEKLIPIEGDSVLKSGDKIKFFVKVEKACFVYLIYHTSQGELNVLFPYRFEDLSRGYPSREQCYIPQGHEWFELDEHTGQETFYLLASEKRLNELEALINRYETADFAKKPELANETLKEIRTLMRENRSFKSFAEKPATIIGQLRATERIEAGGTPDVRELAVEISARDFYSRTFTIDHQ